MKLRDRGLRVSVAAHGDKGEPTRFAGEFVLHQQHFRDRTGLCEIILEIGFRRIEREISDVEFVSHLMFSVLPERGLR
jgi:hypothetical protein